MAIPNGVTPLQYLDQQINALIAARDKYTTYDPDWADLSAGFKTTFKSRTNTIVTNVKAALDDINAVIQARS